MVSTLLPATMGKSFWYEAWEVMEITMATLIYILCVMMAHSLTFISLVRMLWIQVAFKESSYCL